MEAENKQDSVIQEWNLTYDSPRLAAILEKLGWSLHTLDSLQDLLSWANCISIENGARFQIGFARSGMGKYSFFLFDHNLTAPEIKKYNDGCTHIFYKENIVLNYGGGAVGPQCFPND